MTLLNVILSRVLYFILILLNLTLRYRYNQDSDFNKLKQSKSPYLLSIWHQVLVAGILAQKGRPFVVMVSRSKDADAVAYLCKRLKFNVLRGSSSKNGKDKGGQAALSEMVEIVRNGSPGSMTVDGPTGPAKIAKKGIIKLSLETGAPIVPYHAAIESYWEFNSWDQFRFPKPFSRVIITYGMPLNVKDMPLDEAISYVTDKINVAEDRGYSLFSKWQELPKTDL